MTRVHHDILLGAAFIAVGYMLFVVVFDLLNTGFDVIPYLLGWVVGTLTVAFVQGRTEALSK